MSKRKIAENAPRYMNGERGEVVLYRSAEGAVSLEVRLVRDSLWLSLSEIAALFERDKSVISRHLRNIFRSEELTRDAVVAFFATTAADGKTYAIEYYNLDAILSVGYRVNSRRGTQFRIWASGVLRDHLIKGYSANERRLRELKQSLRLVEQALERREVSADEAKALFRLVSDYAYALDLLDEYDHGRVSAASSEGKTEGNAYEEARRIIASLKTRFGASDLFGRERDHGLCPRCAGPG